MYPCQYRCHCITCGALQDKMQDISGELKYILRQVLVSLSTVVLNSRDRQGNLWLP